MRASPRSPGATAAGRAVRVLARAHLLAVAALLCWRTELLHRGNFRERTQETQEEGAV
jgi:hypothetical protein